MGGWVGGWVKGGWVGELNYLPVLGLLHVLAAAFEVEVHDEAGERARWVGGWVGRWEEGLITDLYWASAMCLRERSKLRYMMRPVKWMQVQRARVVPMEICLTSIKPKRITW